MRASTRQNERRYRAKLDQARAINATETATTPPAGDSVETTGERPSVSSSSRPRDITLKHPSGTARLGTKRCRAVGLHKQPCEPWHLKINARGYGEVSINGKMRMAHRVAYELLYGPLPAGYELHHLCENKACVNVDHLVAVTRALHEWITWALHYCQVSPAPEQRHCPAGHVLDRANVYVRSRGGSECVTCNHQRGARYRARRRRERV